MLRFGARLDVNLEEFNDLPIDEAKALLLRCCGSRSWAEQVAQRRPFATRDVIFACADLVWWTLCEPDWLEAFAAHPPIGTNEQTSAWSAEEQSGVNDAGADERQQLADLNKRYYQTFGFVFLICATGKSGTEMLAALRGRLLHTRPEELKIAAREQAKITKIRLEKLL